MIISNIFRRHGNLCNSLIRCKHKDTHWSVVRKKKTPTQKALEHFDDFYKQVFGKSYPAIRQGLLHKQKYVAVVNNFSDTEEIKQKLENAGALNIRTLFLLEKEYLKADYEKRRRKQDLEKVWKMDEASERKLRMEEKDGATAETERQSSESGVAKSPSLERSLEEAEYDTTRIISGQHGESAAALYEFIPATKLKGNEDWILESSHYNYYSNSEFPVVIEREYDIHFPEHLNVYCYETGNYTNFIAPKKGSTGVYNYYLMDGGSVLPVLGLDIKPGHRILDMCASPGGKSLLALQTLYPDVVVCNDVAMSRVDRVYNVLKQYFYDLDERWLRTKKIKVTNFDGRAIPEDNYDRILVDVPCTNDKHSVLEDENNIFKADRIKERLKLPELQCELLVHALKLIRKDGVVVYSTCSLSPIQNDGVVHMALKQIWEETKIEIVIRDLGPALTQVQSVYRLADQRLMKYGHLVLPNLNLNFGPTYFCKLQRIK